MYLSVIIPTRNRANLLAQTLESITRQKYPSEKFEVIVVDNGSTDHTATICDQYSNRLPRFRRIFDDRPGLHVGRHVGLKTSHGEILVYGDDDIVAFPTWLEGVAESFSDENIALVGGKNLPIFETAQCEWFDMLWEDTPFGKVIIPFSILDFGDEVKEVSPLYVWGCNFSIRKKVLQSVGGFHPDGMPWELIRYRGDGETFVARCINDKGFKTIYNPKASVCHWVLSSRMSLEYLYKRAFAQGVSNSYSWVRTAEGLNMKLQLYILAKALRGRVANFAKKKQGWKNKINYIQRQGYWKGVFFHQKELRKDSRLLGWVLKEDYLDS